MKQKFTEADIVADLRFRIRRVGHNVLCRRIGVDPSQASRALNGLAPLTKAIWTALGYRLTDERFEKAGSK